MGSCTLGIDLAAQPRNTAICLIDWSQARGRVVDIRAGLTDIDLLEAMLDRRVSKVGIDAPFGWPTEFVEVISEHARGHGWPDVPVALLDLRETDRFVWAEVGKRPLSVTTDRIAYAAMRCARLLAQYADRAREPVDRSGVAGKPVEVYPAATLTAWGFETRDYKGSKPHHRAARGRLLAKIAAAFASTLNLDGDSAVACEGSDDLLDALVCALVARSVELGESLLPPEVHMFRARIEGWIHLPGGQV